MSTLSDTQFPERIQFFDGQRLFSTDLNALEEFNREMRWLHNVSLHHPGIGRGFAVAGEEGDREITVGPGYALDALGREIVLNETIVKQIPPVADNGNGEEVAFDLLVSYPDDADLDPAEQRDGICVDPGAVRLLEEPEFCWVELTVEGVALSSDLNTAIQSGMVVRLARIWVLNCQLNKAVSPQNRRSARPVQQAHVASGQTCVAGEDLEVLSHGDNVVDISARVDTTSGKFKTTPTYMARFGVARSHWSWSLSETYILDPTPNSFKLRMDTTWLLERIQSGEMLGSEYLKSVIAQPKLELQLEPKELVMALAESFELQAVWMGVEA